MLVSWPPTRERFLLGCTKPEAFEQIDATTVNQVLSARATRSIQIALSDRDGIDVGAIVTQVDDGFEAIVFALAARDLMGSRGYDRAAGADAEIVKLAEEARADLLLMAPGAEGKRVTPLYTLAASRSRQDSLRVNSARRADDWARSPTDPLRFR